MWNQRIFNFKDENLLKKMSAITYSRGPDNEGFFYLMNTQFHITGFQ